jgi:hypothetical protein
MRADLHTMEQIDLYLQGKMAGEELRQFENILSSNPELKSMVNDQQLLIQTVNRKALLAEINMVAGIGGSPWYANPFVAATGVALVVGGIVATVYFMSDSAETQNTPLANEETITPDASENTLKMGDAKQTYYADSTSVSVNENQPQQYVSTNNHVSDNRMEPEYFEAHTPDLNNQADHLSQHADDQVDHIADQYEGDDGHTARNRMASFPMGDQALKEFIHENMRFPGTAKEKKISGNVKVKFLVTSEGTRTNIEANCFNLRDENDKPLTSTQVMLNQKIANLFEREAARIVRIMPTWVPATDSQGNPVLTTAELYFNFSLKDGNSVYYRLD